jgi:hypothetical protein
LNLKFKLPGPAGPPSRPGLDCAGCRWHWPPRAESVSPSRTRIRVADRPRQLPLAASHWQRRSDSDRPGRRRGPLAGRLPPGLPRGAPGPPTAGDWHWHCATGTATCSPVGQQPLPGLRLAARVPAPPKPPSGCCSHAAGSHGGPLAQWHTASDWHEDPCQWHGGPGRGLESTVARSCPTFGSRAPKPT